MVNNIEGIKIHAISCAVPRQKLSLVEYAPDLFTEKSARRMAKGTGFSALRVSDENTTTSDLCAAAAEQIFVNTDRNSIWCIGVCNADTGLCPSGNQSYFAGQAGVKK